MSFSNEILTLLVVLSLGLGVLALFILANAGPRGGMRQGTTEKKVAQALRGHAQAIAQLQAAVRQLATEDRRIATQLTDALQRVGLVRYDAYDDMGGRLSFTAALLDAAGDGMVITSINGRNDTRCYAKPVSRGDSSHNLSDEEAEAIRLAMSDQGVAAAS